MPRPNHDGLRGENALRITLLVLLALSALPFGCIEDWSRWLLICVLSALFCVFLWLGIPIVLSRRQRLALGLGGAYLLWLGCQMVPVPASILTSLSPAAHRLYEIAVPGLGHSEPIGYAYPDLHGKSDPSQTSWVIPSFKTNRPISLNPYGTYRNLAQTSALVGFVIMGLSLFRSGRHRIWLAATLVVLAGFEALYGSIESLSGHQHIFWYSKRYYTDVATGTLVNRNHYAAMLNMILPLGLALMVEPRRDRSKLMAVSSRVFLALALMMAAGILLSGSRMGTAAMFCGLVCLVILRHWSDREPSSFSPARRRGPAGWGWILASLLLLGLGIYAFSRDGLPAVERFKLVQKDLKADAIRPVLWAATTPLVRDYERTGSGSGSFPYALNPTLHGLVLRDFWDFDHAHNDYLETLVTLGIGGTVLGLGAVAILCLRRARLLLSIAALSGLLTLAIHSTADFLLVIPSNALIACALLCLAAEVDDEPRPGVKTSRPRWRIVVGIAIALLLALWPTRSMLAAMIYRPHWNAAPDDPASHDALRVAMRIEPWNGLYPRTLGEGLMLDKADAPRGDLALGDQMREEAMHRRLEVLQRRSASLQDLLRALDLCPVDYSLHAEIAQLATENRTLALECGIAPPQGENARLVSPHQAAAMLSPTAYRTHVALAALLWRERTTLGEPSRAAALGFLGEALANQELETALKSYLLSITHDGPSLAQLDLAMHPPPEAYADLLDSGLRHEDQDLSACATVLEARALLRAARDRAGMILGGAVGPQGATTELVDGRALDDSIEKELRTIRAMLLSVIDRAKTGSPETLAGTGVCGDDRLGMDVLAEEAAGLLERVERHLQ